MRASRPSPQEMKPMKGTSAHERRLCRPVTTIPVACLTRQSRPCCPAYRPAGMRSREIVKAARPGDAHARSRDPARGRVAVTSSYHRTRSRAAWIPRVLRSPPPAAGVSLCSCHGHPPVPSTAACHADAKDRRCIRDPVVQWGPILLAESPVSKDCIFPRRSFRGLPPPRWLL
jgi:hypothetical protein